tara:strand:- start:31966 stop:33822 length:1857 start_codon:yes stop_codon:yes gene_type:complete
MIAPNKKYARCAIYARVSTDDQTRGDYNSLESQHDICRHLIGVHQHEGWQETHFFEDPGFSGKNLERPGIQALIEAIKRREIDVVITYKIDRVARSVRDFFDFWQLLEDHEANFVSATESFDTGTPAGRLMLNMLLGFGQYERELTAERITDKLIERAKRGKWAGGAVPLGYDYDPQTKKLSPNREETALVKRIYTLSAEYANATLVAQQINNEGARTRQRVYQSRDGERHVGGKRFRSDKIKQIVGNAIYKGVIQHRGEEYPGEHEGIITPKLWEKANEALNKLRIEPTPERKSDKHQAALKGLAHCGHCGNSLIPHPSGKKDANGKQYLYYKCGCVNRDGQHSECPLRSVPARPLEKIVVDLIGELGQHPTIIEKSIAQSNSQKQKSLRPLKKKLAELNKRHGEISAQLRRYLELAGKGDRHFSFEIRAEAEKLAADKHAVEIERDKVRIEIDYKERVVTDHQVIAERLRHFKDTFDALPYEDQKEALRLILKSICIKKFDPENDRLPSGKPFTTLQIRTSLYLVQLEFIANDLIPTTYKGGGESSTFVPYGRDDWIRTSDLCVPNAALCQTELHPVIFGIKIKQTHFQNARSLLSRPTGPSLSSCPSPRSSEKPL